MTKLANTTDLHAATLNTYLAALDADDTHYTHKAKLVTATPSTRIHSDGSTSQGFHHRYLVWAEAPCGYQAAFHYVGVDAFGRLGGSLLEMGS